MDKEFELPESLVKSFASEAEKQIKSAFEEATKAFHEYIVDWGNEDARSNILSAAQRIIEDILAGKHYKTELWMNGLYDHIQPIRDHLWKTHGDEAVKASLETKDKRIAFLEKLLENERSIRSRP